MSCDTVLLLKFVSMTISVLKVFVIMLRWFTRVLKCLANSWLNIKIQKATVLLLKYDNIFLYYCNKINFLFPPYPPFEISVTDLSKLYFSSFGKYHNFGQMMYVYLLKLLQLNQNKQRFPKLNCLSPTWSRTT